MNWLLILPLLIPLFTALALLLARCRLKAQRVLSILGTAALLATTLVILVRVVQEGILVSQMGDWPAPFGITLVADLFSTIMLVLAGTIGLTVAVYSVVSMDVQREQFGYYPFFQILLMGVCGAFLTGDIFNLYVWFEVMLVASFVLMALGGERAQTEGAIKYVTLNLMSSAIFLAATGILYGIFGTLNMADLALRVADTGQQGLVSIIATLFLVAFGIKAAAFPFFFWLPASYHTPPPAVSAIFSGLLTKVGVYVLIRIFTLIFVQDIGYTHTIILVIAGLTMVTGVLGAMAQNEFRRILSFHIISQIGYMIMGLAIFTPLALAGSVFYIIHHIIVKTNLFLVSGVVFKLKGTYELKKLGGLYNIYPVLSVLFLIPALSLAGVPPLSGFFAKFVLVKAGLEVGQYVVITAALLVSLLTLFSMSKIWAEVFWKPPTSNVSNWGRQIEENKGVSVQLLLLPVVVLAAITTIIGLAAEPVFNLALQTAEQLLDRAVYIQAVMGEKP